MDFLNLAQLRVKDMKLLKYFESEGEKKSLKKNTCNLKYFKIKNE